MTPERRRRLGRADKRSRALHGWVVHARGTAWPRFASVAKVRADSEALTDSGDRDVPIPYANGVPKDATGSWFTELR